MAVASILATPSSFDHPVASGASLDLESTASAKAKLPGGFEHPTAKNPSAVAIIPSVLPACFPMSDFFSGIASVTHQVFDVLSGHWFACGCPLGICHHLLLSHVAGGHAQVWAGAHIFAIRPSFDSPATSGLSRTAEKSLFYYVLYTKFMYCFYTNPTLASLK